MVVCRTRRGIPRDPHQRRVHLQGEIDMAALPRLRSELAAAERAGIRTVVLDARDLHFIDASGLGVLVEFRGRFARDGRELRVENLGPGPRRVFEVVGLTDAFGVR